jgi:release factor glutamine methyltransferase
LAEIFARAAIASPELDARLLVCAASGLSHEEFISDPTRRLARNEQVRLEESVQRRLQREPVSRILGARSFWRGSFEIGACLDPRPDTETLVEAALGLVREQDRMADCLSILDLGTGSGCILLSLLGELDRAQGLGTDKSSAALDIARANARHLGLGGRADFVCASWCNGTLGQFDLVVANPPYIPKDQIQGLAPEVAQFDPLAALDGGPDGLDAYRAIAPDLPGVLRPGGWALLEIGEGQFDPVVELIAEAGFDRDGDGIRCFEDLAGIARCVAIRRAPETRRQKGVGNYQLSG